MNAVSNHVSTIFTVTLRQHTPMIHFQHWQQGATLRASDLKPRLDAYISHLQPADLPEQEMKDTLVWVHDRIKKQKPVGYQMLIRSSNSILMDIKPKVLEYNNSGNRVQRDMWLNLEGTRYRNKSLFFGETKKMTHTKDINVQIHSFNKNLIELIRHTLPRFLAVTNFGTRSNKGYGSFTVDTADGSTGLEKLIKNSKKDAYYYDITTNNIYVLFTSMYYLYNTLKGGINEGRNNCSKSLLWHYLKKIKLKELYWEKCLFKSMIQHESYNPFPKREYHLIRCLLGLTSEYTFRMQQDVRIDKDCRNGDKMDICPFYQFSLSNPDIERSISPLLFKPVRINNSTYRVYIILKPELYSNKDKKTNINIVGNQFAVRVKQSEEIKDPKWNDPSWLPSDSITNLKTLKDFNLNEFMEYSIDMINNATSGNTNILTNKPLSRKFNITIKPVNGDKK